MKHNRTMLLLLALGMCLGLCVSAHGYADLARSATVVATDFDATYCSALVNDGIASGLPYYWTTTAGFEQNSMTVELDWTSPKTFDTVLIHLYNHPIAYQYYNGGAYGTNRVYHLQKYNTSTSAWEDIATAGAVSDPDDATPFVQFNLPGGVSLDKIRIQDIFDMHEIVVWNRTGNLASSATVTAEYNHADPGYDPTKCVDNDFSTMYFAGSDNDLNMSNTAWMQFDWATPQEFNYVRMYFFPHPSLIEGKLVSLQQETSPDVWENIADAVVSREDSGYYQTADFHLSTNYTLSKLRAVNMFDMFEVDIIKSDQTLLSGYVTESSFWTLSGATVSCSQSNVTTTCANPGWYSMPLNPGPVTFTVSAMGYSDVVETLNVSGMTMSHDFTLTQDPNDLAWIASVTASSEMIPAGLVKDGDICGEWEAIGTPYGDTGLSYYGEWLQLEWPSVVTVDTVQFASGNAVGPMFIQVWKDGVWQTVAVEASPVLPKTVQFAPTQTTKLRVQNLWSLSEIAVYNKLGSVQTPNLTGTITSSRTSGPVASAKVEAGGVSCYTSESGSYSLAAPAGSTELKVTRIGYDDYTTTVVVPSSGSIVQNAVLQTRNIAPTATSATASSEIPGCEAANCKDDLINTLWLANESAGAWVELDWASPVTVNQVKLHGGITAGNLLVEYWDGARWISTNNSAISNVAATFYPVTTTKIKVSGQSSAVELEVDQSNVTPVAGEIGQLKALPDGTAVQTTGSVTSTVGFVGAYVESFNKGAAIKVTPRSPGWTGDNLALSAIASASIVPNPELGGPENANDGNYGNPSEYWPGFDLCFEGPNGVWLQLDWSSPQTFNQVNMYMLDHWLAYARTCELQQYNVSAGAWENIATGRAYYVPGTYLARVSFCLPESVSLDKIRVTNMNDLFEVDVYNADTAYTQDREVSVSGVMMTDASGERYISSNPIAWGDEHKLGALGMTGKALQNSGPDTSPLLVAVCGKVTAEVAFDNLTEYLYIDDGSGAASDIPGVAGVKFGPVSKTLANQGDFVSATGIALYGIPHIVSPRSDADLVIIQDVPGLVNIATEATASDDGREPASALFPVSDANEGNILRFYDPGPASTSSNELWLQLDWTTPRTVNEVMVYFHEWYNVANMDGRVVRLQKEVGGVWTDFASTTISHNGTYYIARFALPSPETIDKLRVVNMATLYEVEVF